VGSAVAEYVRRCSLRLSVRCRPLWRSAVAEYVRRYSVRLSVGCHPLPVCEALQRAGVCRVVFRPAVGQRSPRAALRRALVEASRGSGGFPSHLPNRWVCRRIGNRRHWLAP
jgi:hypothetical protein